MSSSGNISGDKDTKDAVQEGFDAEDFFSAKESCNLGSEELRRIIVEIFFDIGFDNLREIQYHSWGHIMKHEEIQPKVIAFQDACGQGKTLAMIIPAVCAVDLSVNKIQAVLLTHNRELVANFKNEYDRVFESKLAEKNYKKFGYKVAFLMKDEKIEDYKDYHIIFTVASRVTRVGERGLAKEKRWELLKDIYGACKLIMIDEADRVVDSASDMYGAVRDLFRHYAPNASLFMFSATYSPSVRADIKDHYRKNGFPMPLLINKRYRDVLNKNTRHYRFKLPDELYNKTHEKGKNNEDGELTEVYKFCCQKIKECFEYQKGQKAFVFVPKSKAECIAKELIRLNIEGCGDKVGFVHGGVSATDRESKIDNFGKPSGDNILVCTRSFAFGINIPSCTHVFVLVIPKPLKPKDGSHSKVARYDTDYYVHMSSRAGRGSEAPGNSIFFELNDSYKKYIESFIRKVNTKDSKENLEMKEVTKAEECEMIPTEAKN